MKLTIINQHTYNRGDEAAAKALLRALREDKIEQIDILYSAMHLSKGDRIVLGGLRQKHYEASRFIFLDKVVLILTLLLPYFLARYIIRLSSNLNREKQIITSSEKIINAPGGVNLGPYKDWRYLWRLYVAIKEKKDVAVYSISFGPLPNIFLFSSKSKYVLRNVKFLSLRDEKSQDLARETNIDFFMTIDTAFLYNNYIASDIPRKYQDIIEKKFVVIVLNELYRWHPYFKEINPDVLDEKYRKIFSYFVARNIDIVCLPQLFGPDDDKNYMQKIKNQVKSERIHIFDQSDSSDIQQAIIAKAQFVIGARYHSIIFAINNKIPFISLAYEHKMTNSLKLLGLGEQNITIEKMLSDDEYLQKIDEGFLRKDETAQKVGKACLEAYKMSQTTYDEFKRSFLKI